MSISLKFYMASDMQFQKIWSTCSRRCISMKWIDQRCPGMSSTWCRGNFVMGYVYSLQPITCNFPLPSWSLVIVSQAGKILPCLVGNRGICHMPQICMYTLRRKISPPYIFTSVSFSFQKVKCSTDHYKDQTPRVKPCQFYKDFQRN